MLLSCNNKAEKIDKTTTTELDTLPKIEDDLKKETQQDSVLITTELKDTLIYSKKEFDKIKNNHPEFFARFPINPDQLYFNENNYGEFGSEAGQDTYYILYAYFLKQKNGEQKYEKERKKLIDIYLKINSLFGHFQYGGTYFGHQHKRILGYAEYSIYLLPKDKNDIEKTYDISKQKNLYIKSLKQLIRDESKIDFYTLGKEKNKRTKKLYKIVDELDKLITDNFYLRRAQEFHYAHYEYY